MERIKLHACQNHLTWLYSETDDQQVADVGYFTRELGWTPNYNKLNINLSKVIQFVILAKASTLEIKCNTLLGNVEEYGLSNLVSM